MSKYDAERILNRLIGSRENVSSLIIKGLARYLKIFLSNEFSRLMRGWFGVAGQVVLQNETVFLAFGSGFRFSRIGWFRRR